MVRKVVIGVVSAIVVVVVVSVLGMTWWSTRAGTPELSADLEALRTEAVSMVEARPTDVGGGWMAAVTSVETSGAVVRVWPSDESAPGDSAALEVGTSAAVGSCTVALLETHPGRPGSGSGGQTSSALVHVSCPPLPSPTATAQETRD